MNLPAPTVALMSPGDMGHAVGALLRRNGVRVITSLQGRSQRTRDLAVKAGIELMADDLTMVETADLLLSIVVPAEVEALTARLALAIEQAGGALIYVDCNAISPETSRRLGALVERAGARFVDAGIIGPPPREDSQTTRFYASGKAAEQFACLNDFGLDVRVIGEQVGDASAVKMCYAALTKGTTALMAGLSIMAERLGVSAPLRDEFALSQAAAFDRMRQQVPAMVPKAHRWVGEMEEIAKTFETAGLTPKLFEGTAAIYTNVACSPVAQVSQEKWNEVGKSYEQVVDALSGRPSTD